jgi:hypothetical protein
MHRTAVQALACLLLLALAPLPAHAAGDREPPVDRAVLVPLERLWHRLLEALAPLSATVSRDRFDPRETTEPPAEEVPPPAAPTSDLGGTMDPDG